ncbi:2018_t:CDS:2, partial [Racocetra persica]
VICLIEAKVFGKILLNTSIIWGFLMIAINYNTVSDYHWDENDEPNSLCCLVALGDFEGGELCFS